MPGLVYGDVPLESETQAALGNPSVAKPQEIILHDDPKPNPGFIKVERQSYDEAEIMRDLPGNIDRCEEEIVVLTTLKETAEACLQAVLDGSARASSTAIDVSKDNDEDVPATDSELVVRVYEALAGDAGPTEGLDVRIRLQHAGKEFVTSLRPSRSWASDSGSLAGRGGALHVTWNELFRFKGAAVPCEEESEPGPGPDARSLSLAVMREDGEIVASVEVPLLSLLDQRVQHQWCTIGCGWRVYIALQLVRSAAEMLRSHISEFEARLILARTKLTWLQTLQKSEASAS
jgi:hypothetical protein